MLKVDNVNIVLDELISVYGENVKDDLIRKISSYDLVELVEELLKDYDLELDDDDDDTNTINTFIV